MKTQNKQKSLAGHVREGFSGNSLDNHSHDNSKRLSVFNYAEKREELQSNLMVVIKPSTKIIRLFRCFGCEKNFALPKMSSCLVLCRGCHTAARDKGKHAKQNFTAKTLNAIHGFLRRTLQNA
ncbi:MAG: hypothetical protein H0T08_07330 [Acidobacteria bacterium]|jgi:hypothetical protein|nr:hypothetical protein [Acidobacteriota bacterium]